MLLSVVILAVYGTKKGLEMARNKKMRDMIKDHEGAKWILYNGNRIMLKRE